MLNIKLLLILPFIVAASVATIWIPLRIVTHGREQTIVTTSCFISHIVWFEMFKIKTPRFSRMVGASALF